MTVQTETREVVYRGNGVTTTFPTGYPVVDEADLLVERRIFATQVIDSAYLLGTHYTVTNGYPETDATVELLVTPLTDVYEIIITRVVEYTQPLDLINQSGFYPEQIEQQLDRLVMQTQQLSGGIENVNVRVDVVVQSTDVIGLLKGDGVTITGAAEGTDYYKPGGVDVAVVDGGTGSSTAGGARTNLGATTVGGNIFTLTNPSAITFLRMNADNSVSALDAATFKTAIGAGAGSGDMVAANNLSDLASATTALTNLGLTANGKSLVTAANYAAMKTLLALVIGTDIPARLPTIQAVASSATVTPTFADDQVNITAQAVGLTLANPTGTAADGWGIAVRIKDNGTARTIGYGTQYRAVGVTLPTTTVLSKTLYLGMVFNNADTKWDVVAVAQEA